MARVNRNILLKLTAPVIGLALAIGAHATHNVLADLSPGVGGLEFTTLVDWLSWLLMLAFIIIVMLLEQRDLKKYLHSEIEKGALTEDQFNTAISFSKYPLPASRLYFWVITRRQPGFIALREDWRSRRNISIVWARKAATKKR